MALREFTDENDVAWRAWDVTPQGLRPGSVGERFLSADVFVGVYAQGWLCFESSVGRRRLTGFATDWAGGSDDDLRRLLGSAQSAPEHEDQETTSGSDRRFAERRSLVYAEWREGLPRRRKTDPRSE